MNKLPPIAALALLASACTQPAIGDGEPGGADAAVEAPIVEPPSDCEESVPVSFDQHRTQPDIMLVVDKSGSMGDPLDDGLAKKWDIMRQAIAQLIAGSDQPRYGLLLYPWRDDCRDGQVRVGIGGDNHGEILTELNGATPAGNTPIHQSLRQARFHFMSTVGNPDGRYVLLATDGLPQCSTEAESIAEISALRQMDIDTFVLGFGQGAANAGVLANMAQAGGRGTFYGALSVSDLSAALTSIVEEVSIPSCEFKLGQTPSNPAFLEVEADGQAVPMSELDGWTYYPSDNSVMLTGTFCERVKSGAIDDLRIDMGCDDTTVD